MFIRSSSKLLADTCGVKYKIEVCQKQYYSGVGMFYAIGRNYIEFSYDGVPNNDPTNVAFFVCVLLFFFVCVCMRVCVMSITLPFLEIVKVISGQVFTLSKFLVIYQTRERAFHQISKQGVES